VRAGRLPTRWAETGVVSPPLLPPARTANEPEQRFPTGELRPPAVCTDRLLGRDAKTRSARGLHHALRKECPMRYRQHRLQKGERF
jgi:hypothetical protein